MQQTTQWEKPQAPKKSSRSSIRASSGGEAASTTLPQAVPVSDVSMSHDRKETTNAAPLNYSRGGTASRGDGRRSRSRDNSSGELTGSQREQRELSSEAPTRPLPAGMMLLSYNCSPVVCCNVYDVRSISNSLNTKIDIDGTSDIVELLYSQLL